MPPLTVERLASLLAEYARQYDTPVDLLLIGGLALQAYGNADRATQDVDGEMAGNPESLAEFLKQHQIPADLGENISGWAIVAMPSGYRNRAFVWHERPGVRLRLLAPSDFIISKLRRGTDLDMDDAAYVAQRFGVLPQQVRDAACAAIQASPKDTTLSLFRKTVEIFCAMIETDPASQHGSRLADIDSDPKPQV